MKCEEDFVFLKKIISRIVSCFISLKGTIEFWLNFYRRAPGESHAYRSEGYKVIWSLLFLKKIANKNFTRKINSFNYVLNNLAGWLITFSLLSFH